MLILFNNIGTLVPRTNRVPSALTFNLIPSYLILLPRFSRLATISQARVLTTADKSDTGDYHKHTFSIQEGQDIIKELNALKSSKSKWTKISLPHLLAKSFQIALAFALVGLEDGKAFAAHFLAAAPANNFISLGPSIIVTKNADVQNIFKHLVQLNKFYEESYDLKLENHIILRLRDIGLAQNLIDSYFRKAADTTKAIGPWGALQSAAALPIPHFDFLRLRLDFLKEINLRSSGRDYVLASGRFSINGIKMNTFNPYRIEFVLDHGKYINYLIDQSSLPNHSWDFFNPKLPYNLALGTYSDLINNISIPFFDSELDESLIARTVRNLNLHIDRKAAAVVGFNKDFAPRRFIHTAKPAAKFSNDKIITADIEALIHKRKENIPYAAAFFTHDASGKEVFRSFKWQDFNLDSNLLLQNFWLELVKFAKGKTVYFHNWNGYDAFHALNPLVIIAQKSGWALEPLLRHGKIIHIKVYSIKNNKRSLIFDIKDSLLLLPGGLGSLAKAFKLPSTKEHFPHYFDVINVQHDANYVGPWPEYSAFEPKRTSIQDYNNLIKENPVFDFMAHTIKYLTLDVVLLHQILSKFLVELKNEFKIDARKNLSIPGVAFKAWKIHQLPILLNSAKNAEVYDFSEKYDSFFRNAYLGGIVDVYKPHVKNAFYYDVNSLYPTAMLRDLPVGRPIFQNLTVDQFINSDWFGFIHATVKAPDNLNIGILAVRRDGKLITPSGTFTGTWFSEEVRLALEYGYTIISIAYGYKFNKSNKVFDQFINNLASMKIVAEKDGLPAKRNIAKLLMNSTYGRFGMHISNAISTIVPEKDAITIMRGFEVYRSIPFTNGFELIEYNPTPDPKAIELGLVTSQEIKPFLSDNSQLHETNVPIAAAITAHSRIIINSYKMQALKLGIDVIYSDTDSLVVNKKVPDSWLDSTEFGKFKLEHIIKEGFFIAPKLYYLDAIDPNTGKSYSVSKSRGYNGSLNLDQIKLLYEGKSISLSTTKWYRSWNDHGVHFNMDSPLEITGSFNKRSKVFENQGNWISTKPLIFNDPPVEILRVSPVQFDQNDIDSGYFSNIQRTLSFRNNKPLRHPSAFK